MAAYYRLTDGGSPTGSTRDFQPPFSSEYADEGTNLWAKAKKWWQSHVLGQPVQPPTPSGYLTLIPLNDSRLKPRRTTLLVVLLLVFALSAATATFFLVPRGVSAGGIDIHSDRMSWNTSKGTYQLNLLARLPIYNPNYLNAKVMGKLRVYFYDTEAGSETIKATVVPARSSPHILEVVVDASNVPSEYALTILSECAAFPRRLVFFLKGSLTATYLAQKQVISPIDTYFMISCLNGDTVPKEAPPPPPGAPDEPDDSPTPPQPPEYLEFLDLHSRASIAMLADMDPGKGAALNIHSGEETR